MSFLKFAYFKSGEIVTALAVAVFAFYIVRSFAGGQTILENEHRSESMVRAIYMQQMSLLEETGTYGGFEKLSARSPVIAGLNRIPWGQDDSLDLATDGRYLYLIQMVYPIKSASVLVQESGRDDPSGFHCLSWPVRFASTGEICLYVNETGGMAVAPNIFGTHDGYNSFPPDSFIAPAEAAAGKAVEGEDQWLKLDDLR